MSEDIAEVLPSADEVVTYIRQGYCDWVVDMPARTRAMPEELWLPALQVWVRADGSLIGGGVRGHRRPGAIGRLRIRRAVEWFRGVTERESHLLARENGGAK